MRKESMEFEESLRRKNNLIFNVSMGLALIVLFICVGIMIHYSINAKKYCHEHYGSYSQFSLLSLDQNIYSCITIENNEIKNHYFTKTEFMEWKKSK